MNSRQQLEAAIERKCVAYAAENGIPGVKLDRSARSWPDYLFFTPVTPTVVEFKRPGEQPRPQQEKRRRDLKQLGYPVSVIYSLAEFKDLIGRFQRSQRDSAARPVWRAIRSAVFAIHAPFLRRKSIHDR